MKKYSMIFLWLIWRQQPTGLLFFCLHGFWTFTKTPKMNPISTELLKTKSWLDIPRLVQRLVALATTTRIKYFCDSKPQTRVSVMKIIDYDKARKDFIMKRFFRLPRSRQSLTRNCYFWKYFLASGFFALLLPNQVLAGNSFGVGYFSGPTSGPTVNVVLSRNNSIKVVAPFSFSNVVCDYQYRIKNFSKGNLKFSFYLGIGTDLIISGQNDNVVDKKKPGKDDENNKPAKNDGSSAGQFAAALRIPLGVEFRWSSFPVDIYAELAPSLQIFDGKNIGADPGNIDWKAIGFGARYYF